MTCPPTRTLRQFCPDLGRSAPADRPLTLGDNPKTGAPGPYEFPACPGYWRREPGAWALHLPWAVDTRSAYTVAVNARHDYEHGYLRSLARLPGKLAEAILILTNEDRRRAAR